MRRGRTKPGPSTATSSATGTATDSPTASTGTQPATGVAPSVGSERSRPDSTATAIHIGAWTTSVQTAAHASQSRSLVIRRARHRDAQSTGSMLSRS